MLGDNVYGDTERSDLMELKLAYEKQRKILKVFNLIFLLRQFGTIMIMD